MVTGRRKWPRPHLPRHAPLSVAAVVVGGGGDVVVVAATVKGVGGTSGQL